MSYNPSVGGRQTLRSSATAISTSYDSSSIPVTRMQNNNTLMLLCDLTLNTATSVEIQVEVAVPAELSTGQEKQATDLVDADFYPLSTANISGLTVGSGVITAPTGATVMQLAATGKYALVLKNVLAKWVRVKAKTTAGPGSTTLNIVGVQGLS